MLLEFFLFYFNKICDIFLSKVQQSYCYTQFCNYREEFEFKLISSEFNIVFDTSFSSLILHAVNLLLWKKILSLTLLRIITVYTDQAPFSEFSLLRDQDVALRERILGKMGGEGGILPARPQVWTLPFCWISPTPKNWVLLFLPWLQTKHWKKRCL